MCLAQVRFISILNYVDDTHEKEVAESQGIAVSTLPSEGPISVSSSPNQEQAPVKEGQDEEGQGEERRQDEEGKRNQACQYNSV